jgi:uncharacterized membrane protein
MSTPQRLYSAQENKSQTSNVNVGQTERMLSLVAGGGLALYGILKGTPLGLLSAILGGYQIYRGSTGNCPVYSALGVNTAVSTNKHAVTVPHQQGIHIEKTVFINRPPEEVFAFWRNFENLPRFMNHLESVKVQDEDHSHWVAKAPAGLTVAWDAQIVNEIPNELIAWRSLENAQIANAGSVRFLRMPNNGTEVKVTMEYVPPAGQLGAAIAKALGEEPSIQVEEDLNRLKHLFESGQISYRGAGMTAGGLD